ncbi:MAG: cyclopropane-fatty-acyl-phospholipid synthase family protein, partial [Gemmataceae bacterium]
MPFDDLKLLSRQLENLQNEIARCMEGEPFQGFQASMQKFQAELQNAGAEIAELEALEAEAAAEPERAAVPSVEELLQGGETCQGLEHILGVVPKDPGEATFRPDIRTPLDLVERMLTLANVSSADTVYDLGCSDGRIPIYAAEKFGARGVGIELLPERAQVARLHVQLKKLDPMVTILQGDALETNLSKATVVT